MRHLVLDLRLKSTLVQKTMDLHVSSGKNKQNCSKINKTVFFFITKEKDLIFPICHYYIHKSEILVLFFI